METNFLSEVHPRIVHFPIALLSLYSLLEIFGIIFKNEFISKSALLVLCIGVVTSLLAVLSGNQAAENFKYWTDQSLILLNNHQSFATYLLWFSAIICALRIYFVNRKIFYGWRKNIFLVFAVITLFLVVQTGLYGGDLVKKFGIGTDVYQNYENE